MREKSLDQLYEEYARDVYRYLFSLSKDHGTAEDIMQETFYRAYLHIEQLSDEKIKPWLFRVAHNTYIDLKRKNRRESLAGDHYFEQLDGNGSIEEHFVQKERLTSIFEKIDTLPLLQKQALLLVTTHHFTYKEAAKIIAVSESHLRILIFRARKTLKERERRETNE